MTKREKTWWHMYRNLCSHLASQKTYPSKKANKELYVWISLQRVAAKKKLLSAKSVKALDKIKFIWDKQEASWIENFNQLKTFRKMNPAHWPSQRSTNTHERALAVWMLYNRREINRKRILPMRLKLLKQIGFPVDPTEEKWEQNFLLAKKFISRYKRFPVRTSDLVNEKKIHAWLRYQVVKMNFGSLPKNRIQKLRQLKIKKFADILRDEELALSAD